MTNDKYRRVNTALRSLKTPCHPAVKSILNRMAMGYRGTSNNPILLLLNSNNLEGNAPSRNSIDNPRVAI